MANKFTKKAPSSAKQLTKAKPKRTTAKASVKSKKKKGVATRQNALHRLGGAYATKSAPKKATAKKTTKKKKSTSKKKKSTAKPKAKSDTHKRKKQGFARTKNYPHKRHPAHYKKTGKDDIEYVTFTHSDIVKLDNNEYKTVHLTSNIDKKAKNNSHSRVLPLVFVGKRSALGKEEPTLTLTKEDKAIVDKVFKNSPKKKVPRTGGHK